MWKVLVVTRLRVGDGEDVEAEVSISCSVLLVADGIGEVVVTKECS